MNKLIIGLLGLVLSTSLWAAQDDVFYRSGKYMAIRPNTCLVTDLTIPAQVVPQGPSSISGLLMSFLPRFVTLDEYIAAAPTQQEKDDIYVACGILPPPIVLKRWVVATNGIYLARPAKQLVTDPVTSTQTRVSSKIRYAVGTDCDNSVPVGYMATSTGGKQWRFFAGQTTYVVVCEEK